jgi:hypothetical protein
MPPVVFCLCPNCSCFSPVFNISDVVEIPAEDDQAQDAADSSGVVIVGEEDEGSSEMGGNLFGLLSFLVLVVLITVGKYRIKNGAFSHIFDPALLDLEVAIAKNVVYFHRNE